VERGRVEVDGSPALDPALRLRSRQAVRLGATPKIRPAASVLVFEDRHIVVAEKPAGISSVPYRRGERKTLMDAVRAEWKSRGVPPTARVLHVVHRLDKDSSGLLVYARTRAAERALQGQFRRREVSRVYLCLAHGPVESGTIESRVVPDRGDGLRGSAPEGKLAITHVRVLKKLPKATLCEARLETGRTHQIRIHFAESGHPLVGERVYVRDFVSKGGRPIPSPRLMLHAAKLAFNHPISARQVRLESPRTEEFLSLADMIGSGQPLPEV
jgi:23S rRNA pseudouridine1911/1915/1917 synthase